MLYNLSSRAVQADGIYSVLCVGCVMIPNEVWCVTPLIFHITLERWQSDPHHRFSWPISNKALTTIFNFISNLVPAEALNLKYMYFSYFDLRHQLFTEFMQVKRHVHTGIHAWCFPNILSLLKDLHLWYLSLQLTRLSYNKQSWSSWRSEYSMLYSMDWVIYLLLLIKGLNGW